MTPIRRLTSALLVLFGLALAGCDKGPDDAAARAVLDQRLAAALKPPVTEVARFRRIGSGPLPATADGKARRIVYFNTELKLNQDVDFASWNGLNASAFATLLGATEKGVLGIKQGGNKAGDLLRVHGSATFVDEGGSWAAVPWVAPEVGKGSPENNTGPPSEAKRLLDAVQALLADGGGDRALRSAIVAEELAKAYGWMQLRVDRLDQAFVLAGGQAGGEYANVAAIIAGEARRARIGGARRRHRRQHRERAAGDAEAGRCRAGPERRRGAGGERGGAVRADGAMAELRALGSLFPEPIQIVTARDSRDRVDRRPEGQARRARAGRAPARAPMPRRCWPPAAWRRPTSPRSRRPGWPRGCACSRPARSTR